MDHGTKDLFFQKKLYKKIGEFFFQKFSKNGWIYTQQDKNKKNPPFFKGRKKNNKIWPKNPLDKTLALMEVQNPMDKMWITSVAIGNGTLGPRCTYLSNLTAG